MRMIDADEAYKVLTDYYHQKTEIQHKALKEAIERVPTVDVDSLNAKHEDIGYEKGYRDGYAEALEMADNTEHIRHGHWILSKDKYWKTCSECGTEFDVSLGMVEIFTCDTDVDEMNYCSNCGAKMDEVSE